MTRGLTLLCVCALALPAASHANRVYRWTDRDGVVHYGDQAPQDGTPRAGIRTVAVEAQPAVVARIRMENDGDAVAAWVENDLAGPIEVRLRQASGAPVAADPLLPARATVPAQSAVVVARLAAPVELLAEVTPGSSNARPRDVEYRYPLQSTTVRVEQGFGGAYTHHDEANRYAVDFATPVGTPVLAARDGTVMQAEGDFDGNGSDGETFAARANFIRILHDDGTMALYAHLRQGGVLVRQGQRVRAGDRIGLSGNTGYSAGPHLHFVVQANRGMRLQAVPFRMFGPQGILRFTEGR